MDSDKGLCKFGCVEVMKLRPRSRSKGGKVKVPSKQKQAQPRNSPDSAIFIKWYAMIHSGGVSGPMVLVVADKRMTAVFFCMRLPEKLPREPPTTQVQPKLVKEEEEKVGPRSIAHAG